MPSRIINANTHPQAASWLVFFVFQMSTPPVCLEDFERHAAEVLPRPILDYYRSGANSETTLRWNRSAFDKWANYPFSYWQNASHKSPLKFLFYDFNSLNTATMQ